MSDWTLAIKADVVGIEPIIVRGGGALMQQVGWTFRLAGFANSFWGAVAGEGEGVRLTAHPYRTRPEAFAAAVALLNG